MQTITVSLPSETYQLLEERARKAGKPAREILLELLEEALKSNTSLPAKLRKKQTVAQILSDSGRLRTLSPYLQGKIVADVTLKDVQASLQKAGGKSLSDVILEQRGPKDYE